jgi:lipopolysaccharide/colanic/teichoic acid biosynthesis glycosyltransferase
MDVPATTPQHDIRRTPAPARRSAPVLSVSGPTVERQRTLEAVAFADVAHPADAMVERERSELANRVVNVAIAGVALTALLPVMVATAIEVKLTSPGPIFYTQIRVGIDRRNRRGSQGMYDRRTRDLGGAAFKIYKFRSMSVNAEQGSGAVWATRNDPRVTPLGKALRKYRIDELPQLINVLMGDMNIVGPRPERPSIFARLSDQIADYPLRQRARPGITGHAQINHSYDTTIDDVRTKVRYDLEYISRQGIATDLGIMIKTVPVMLFKKGGW